MGYSTLEGLMMATRCGDVDPGLLLEVLTAPGADPAQIRHDLYHTSGLLGVSGRSARLSELLDHPQDPRCQLAVDMYCHRIRRHIGASLAVLGGADALIFGGGVGENEPRLRARILQGLEWAGFALDAAANERHDTAGRSGCRAIGAGDPAAQRRVLVGTVDESQQMARMLKPLID
jgi:acetate kinase